MTVLLARSVETTLLDHAREGRPREVCGVLAGHRGADGGEGGETRAGESEGETGAGDGAGEGEGDGGPDRVERAVRTRNVADDPQVAYEIPPEQLHRVLTDVESDGLAVVGFYHSHPTGPAAPSPTDRAAATWTGHLYVVVAPEADRQVRAWRWSGEAFEEASVERP